MKLPAPKFSPRFSRRDLRLGLLVGVSMLAITSLYALTLRYQNIHSRAAEAPRWSVLTEDVATRLGPVKAALSEVKQSISALSQAQHAQSQAVSNLKARIESATGPL